MNAYELAGELEKKDRLWNIEEQLMIDVCHMLRQQADRIAELEKDFAWAKDQWNKDRICFESRRNELEKDLVLKTRDRDVFCNFTLAYEKRIEELEKVIQDGIKAFGYIQEKQLKNKLGNSISAEEYQKTHEGFSTIQEVIAKHEAIPSRKEAIDKAREWLKDYRIDSIVVEPQTKPLSDEEIKQIWYNLYPLSSSSYWDDKREGLAELKFARAIEERHGIK